MSTIESDFYVVAREMGSFSPSLPAWANKTKNTIPLSLNESKVTRLEVKNVPGAFQLLNVFSKTECKKIIETSENLAYNKDAAVSLARDIRHNETLTWIIDEETHNIIWNRVKDFVFDKKGIFENKKALGINKRFRFYKYEEGDFFKVHSDGAWPGSAVVNNKLLNNAYDDRFSQMTFLIFLSEDFEGGETQFFIDKNDSSKPTRDITQVNIVNIRTPAGAVLCFPHGLHPLHCLHSSALITSGIKYVIRTDLLFEI